jgi:hypothetical protein
MRIVRSIIVSTVLCFLGQTAFAQNPGSIYPVITTHPPVPENVLFKKSLDATIQDSAPTVTSADAADNRINVGETAYFAFYYDNSQTCSTAAGGVSCVGKAWYVNQNGTKTECNPEETDPTKTPGPCATSTFYLNAPDAKICIKYNPAVAPPSAAAEQDAILIIRNCADKNCSAFAQDWGSPPNCTASSCKKQFGQHRCHGARLPMIPVYQSLLPQGWNYIIKEESQAGNDDLTADTSVHIWITGTELDITAD